MEKISELIRAVPIMQFLLICVMVVFASSKVTIQSAASRRHIRGPQDSLLYNSMFFAFVALTLTCFFSVRVPNAELLLWSLMLGVTTVAFQVIFSIALTTGPVSLTTLISNLAVIVPTIISAIVFREKIYFSQLFGIIMLIISLPLSMKEAPFGEMKISRKWVILSAAAFLGHSALTTVQKLFIITESSKLPGASVTFLTFAYLFSAGLAFIIYLTNRFVLKKGKHGFKLPGNVILFALGMGIALALYQRTQMIGIENIPGSFMFPAYAGLQSLSMTAIGIVMFGDRLSRRQMLGVMCGILSIIFINIKVGAYFTLG